MKTLAIISSQAFSLVNFRGELIRSLVRASVRVYALAPDYNDELRQQIMEMGGVPIDFQLSRTGMNPWTDVLDMIKLVAILRDLRPDIALSYFIKPVIFGTLAAWIARVPRRVALIEGLGYIFTCGEESSRRMLLRKAVSLLYRVGLSQAHKVIFLNSDDIAEFVNSGLVNDAKVVHLGGIGVDLNEWSPEPAIFEPVTFLLVARLLREKGVVEYVEAAKIVKTLHPKIRFVLLGGVDANPGSLTLSEVQEWVDDNLIVWPGHVCVKQWLKRSSVFVLPSYREGLPRSTQEAMSMGRAIITTDVPGCRDTVVDGRNGFLVPVRDVSELAKAMIRFIDNRDLIDKMGRESRKLAEERFNVHKINRRMFEILGIE